MLHVLNYTPDWRRDPVLRSMFSARKRVFIDLLKWDLPTVEDHYEIDRFDEPGAVYLILSGPNGEHRASARLLPTGRPHLLESVFATLCRARPPKGDAVREITRFCLDRHQGAAQRRSARNELIRALADYALAFHIATYTGVAEMPWFRQIAAFGWHCEALGPPREVAGQTLTALRINITSDTPALLASAGIHSKADDIGETRHAA